jgi:transposase
MIKAAELRKKELDVPEAIESLVYEFGAVSALLDVAERLGVREIIDKHTRKRNQGLPIGDSILLAAINRAVFPVSKNALFEDWFERTVLTNSFPKANRKNLSRQGFWNNMSQLSSEKIRLIEDCLSEKIINTYNVPNNCLFYHNINFYTYINTDNDSTLAKRGKSKEHREDLKIVGLSLMVSKYYNIPLFHEVYPENMNDAKIFSKLIDKLKEKYLKIDNNDTQITFIFDKRNNLTTNIELLLKEDSYKFNFIGSLDINQAIKLLKEAENNYKLSKISNFNDITAYRTSKEEFGIVVTIVITHNPELYEKQLRGIFENIQKCKDKLNNLIKKLDNIANRTIISERDYTLESIIKKINNILHAEYMKTIFDFKVYNKKNSIKVDYLVNEDKLKKLKSIFLGKSILFTNRHDWSNEEIIGAYRSQYHLEECFKQMKNDQYLNFRPIMYFKDDKIKVHIFYCVLSLQLCSLLNLEINKLGYNISINKMLIIFSDVQQVISLYNIDNQIKSEFSFSRFNKMVKSFDNIYNLKKYSFNYNKTLKND